MADEFGPGDPIGAWLASEVELLRPGPGGFQKVRRRARRRKAARALSAGTGAIIAIAAIVTGPRIASSLLEQAAPAHIAGAQTSPSGGSRPSAEGHGKSGSPAVAGSAVPLAEGTPMSPVSGIPVPPGFTPESVTFVGPNTGAVLGQLGTPCDGACVALASTADYGKHWYAFSGPHAAAAAGDTGVSQVRFLNKLDGWVYGPELYDTHNGGATWTKIAPQVSGRVIDLETVGGRAFAVVATCSGTGAAYATGCAGFALMSAAAGSDRWAPVAGASGTGAVVPGGLVLSQTEGYLIVSGGLYTGPVSGGPWQLAGMTSGAPTCLTPAGGATGAVPGLLATGIGKLYLVCQPAAGGPPEFYEAAGPGLAWISLGAIGVPGQVTSMAVQPPTPGSRADGAIELATIQGLYYSAGSPTSNPTWSVAAIRGGTPAGGFSYVGMTDSGNGVAVPAGGQAHEIYTTADGGHHWQPSVIG